MRALSTLLVLLSLSACTVIGDPDPEGIIACAPEADVSYPDLGEGVDYFLEEGCEQWDLNGVTVTLEPGVTVEIPDGAYITVEYDAALIAEGTAELPITLQGSDSSAPTWLGMQITSANNDTSLDHLVIDGAGDGGMIYLDEPTSLSIWSEGQATIGAMTIRNGAGHGLSVLTDNLGEPGSFGPGLAFANLDGVPIVTEAHHLVDFDFGDYSATEVDSDGIELYVANSNNDLEEDTVWADVPVPLIFRTSLRVEESLELGPGMELRFSEGHGLQTVGYGGTEGVLDVQGTEADPVLLRGVLDLPSSWAGVCISTKSPANRIAHAEIRHGGDSPWTWEERGANLTLGYGEASLTAENVLIASSADVGVLLDNDLGDVSWNPVNVTYVDNPGGDVLDVRD